MNYSLTFYRQAKNAKIKQEEQGRGRAKKRMRVGKELVIDLTD